MPENSRRQVELRKMLEQRRRETMAEVQGRMRDVRLGKPDQSLAEGVSRERLDVQEDIELALIQMKSETLNKLDAALRRLDDGSYGDCFVCGGEISGAHLRALPFAVRCKDCAEQREEAERMERRMTRRGGVEDL